MQNWNYNVPSMFGLFPCPLYLRRCCPTPQAFVCGVVVVMVQVVVVVQGWVEQVVVVEVVV